MIIDFTVKNFRSFRTEQLFSMNVESARERHSDNYDLLEGGKLAVLRSAAILGPNASGKSNLLAAFQALRSLICESYSRREDEIIDEYTPYRLSQQTEQAPVGFEIEFIVPSGTRYRYGIQYVKDRILSERLDSFATGRKANIFNRGPEDTWETIRFGIIYKGKQRRFSFFPNVPYLSRAGNDAAASDFIREIYRFFNRIRVLSSGERPIIPRNKNDPRRLQAAFDIICRVDTGVANIRQIERELPKDFNLPDELPNDLRNDILEEFRRDYVFDIKSDTGDLLEFNRSDMSDGTTWMLRTLPLILWHIEEGRTLFFDEIDSHLHSNILETILNLFHDPEINCNHAQIIFTTHDTNILNSDLLRRDQIWFVSKENGASNLCCLDEFDKNRVRHDGPFESFYLDGRLGALPNISFASIKQAILAARPQREGDDA